MGRALDIYCSLLLRRKAILSYYHWLRISQAVGAGSSEFASHEFGHIVLIEIARFETPLTIEAE